MCNKLTLGIAAGCLFWCWLAAFPHPAWAKRIGPFSCSAMTVCGQRPVIAFSNWGAGPVGNENELIIATAANGAPLSQENWRFHVLRDGLQVLPDEDGFGQIALFPVGAGVGLVSTHWVIGVDGPTQVFAAWSPGFPQGSADWVVSPTGIGEPSQNVVAGTGTEEYIAAAVIPEEYFGQTGAWRIPGIYLAMARLPLNGSYADWNTAGVQIDSVKGLQGAKRPVRVIGNPMYLSLAACKAGLFLACAAEITRYSVLGYPIKELALVVGQCQAPTEDPTRWDFIAVDADALSAEVTPLVTDGAHLYLAYNRRTAGELCVADCPVADAMDPSAWHIRQVAQEGPFPALGLVGGQPAVACWDLGKRKSASGLAVKYVFAAPGQAGQEWPSCPVQQLTEYLSVGDIGGRPVLSSFTTSVGLSYHSYNGSLDYTWTDKPIPLKEADWHVSTVFAGQPPEESEETSTATNADAPAVADTAVFPPIPVPGPTEKLAAGAVRVPAFKLTWQLVVLAGLVLAAAAWSARMWRNRRAGMM